MQIARRGASSGVTARMGREIAARWVSEEGVRTPGFVGAFLHGSINWLPDEAQLPATSDLDIMLVLQGDVPSQKPGKFQYDDLLLEVSYLPLSAVSTVEQVLGDAHLAGSFHRPSILADTTGHLTAVQLEVAKHYTEEVWVLRRLANVEAKMRRPFPPVHASFPEQVNCWLFSNGLTTHLLLVAGLRNPTVRLRYLAVRALMIEHGMLANYTGLLEDLGVVDMSSERAFGHLAALECAFADAARVIRSPLFFAADISAGGYPVAIGGSRELIERGEHREAIFWLTATAVRCQQVFIKDAAQLLSRHESGFMALLADLGIRDRTDLIARREATLARLPERWNVAREIIALRRDTSASMG